MAAVKMTAIEVTYIWQINAYNVIRNRNKHLT